MNLIERLLNEPALLIALLLAGLNFIGVDPEQAEQLRQHVIESVALLLGGGVIRQTVYGPKTVDEILDAEAVINPR